MRVQSFQRKELATRSVDVAEKEKINLEILAECYASTTVNLATAPELFSRMCLESLEVLDSDHKFAMALSVQSWPGVLQMFQKHIKG